MLFFTNMGMLPRRADLNHYSSGIGRKNLVAGWSASEKHSPQKLVVGRGRRVLRPTVTVPSQLLYSQKLGLFGILRQHVLMKPSRGRRGQESAKREQGRNGG